MRTISILFALIIIVSPISKLYADEGSSGLGTCMTDSLNGKERKELAKWVFFAMSSHNVIKPFSNLSQTDIDESNKFMAKIVTRLMTEDCPKQTKKAYKINGVAAIENAFRIVGEVAMQELMTDPQVNAAFGAYSKFLDQDKFNNIFQE